MIYNAPTWVNNQSPAINASNLNELCQAVQQDGIEISELQNQLASPFNYKGSVLDLSDLPSTGNTENDTYYVKNEGYLVSWNGTAWSQSSIDETDYLEQITAIQNDIAPEYDSTSTYSVGEYCIYDGQLYRCTTEITTAEAWTAAHWTAVTVTGEVTGLKSAVNALSFSPEIEWTIGMGATPTGIGASDYTALSDMILCQSGDKIVNKSALKDESDNYFVIYAALYKSANNINDTFDSRISFQSTPLVIPDDITGVRISVGRISSSGVVFSSGDLNYFAFDFYIKGSNLAELYECKENIESNKYKIRDIENVVSGYNFIYPAFRPYIITNAGKWYVDDNNNSTHIVYPVRPGDLVEMKGSAVATAYAFLTSDNYLGNSGNNAAMVVGTSRQVLNANAEVLVTIPAGCGLLYISATNSLGQSILPVEIKINGISQTTGQAKKIYDAKAVIRGLNENKAQKADLDIWGARHAYEGENKRIVLPDFDFLSGYDLPIYGSKYRYKHYIDLSKYKNASLHTYVANDQTDLSAALANAISGDTIILKNGRYTPITITKSINLIGAGNVVFSPENTTQFVTTATAGVYKTADNSYPASPNRAFDISRIADGIITELTLSNDGTTGVVNNPGTWYWHSVSKNIYIHLYGEIQPNPDDIVFTYAADDNGIFIKPSGENAKVYMENIIVIGGKANVHYEDVASYNNQALVAVDCKMYYARFNALALRGVKGYFQNCECAYARMDGFNYHINNTGNNEYGDNTGTLAHGLEVDCIGHDNGIGDTGTAYSDNGTTCHDGGKMIRIGGVYYNNKGGNVADKDTETESYNYNCYAFDSVAPNDTNKADFWASLGTNMYLYGCRANGDSQYNLMAANSATIHFSGVEYTTHTGAITPIN